MIPRIIHYCWFGGKEIPDNYKRYMDSWEKYMPDYQIMKWDERTYNIDTAPTYVQEAYTNKKYAFVSDYVRLIALYEYGGVYFDTDIEVLKNFDNLISGYSLVLGHELTNSMSTGVIIAERKNPIIRELLETYHSRKFVDEDGTLDLTTINEGMNKVVLRYGVDLTCNREQELECGIKIYRDCVFSSFDMKHWHERITDESVTVHHMASTWVTQRKRINLQIRSILRKVIGTEMTDRIQDLFKR